MHLFDNGQSPVSPPIDRTTAAEMLNVSPRSVASSAVVRRKGGPELIQAVERGTASVSAAAEVASLPKPKQKETVARGEAEIVRAANAIKRERKATKPAKRDTKPTRDGDRPPSTAQGDLIICPNLRNTEVLTDEICYNVARLSLANSLLWSDEQ